MSSGGAAADSLCKPLDFCAVYSDLTFTLTAAIYAMGASFAEEDQSLADKKTAQIIVRDGEKAFSDHKEDLNHTEDHFDPE